MKKLLLITVTAAMMVLLMSVAATAALQPYYHGDFSTATTGCAKCHVTHAATQSGLLKDKTTVTDFCFSCHADNLSSPYNANTGQIMTKDGFVPSVAGGFDTTFKFDDVAYNFANASNVPETTLAQDVANYKNSTSMHGVVTATSDYDTNDWVSGKLIPGGVNNLSGDFACTSCHNPHAGGTYPINAESTHIMPRLLNAKLFATTFNPDNYNDWTFTDGTGATGSNPQGYRSTYVAQYGQNTSKWCAGCHDLFNMNNSHNTVGLGFGMLAVNNASIKGGSTYMHRMDFALAAQGVTDLGTANTLNRVPLAKNNYLTCLTCHRAHGTASDVANNVVFRRANDYLHGDGTVASDTQTSTVLLREKDRNVCYDCHKDASINTPAKQGS